MGLLAGATATARGRRDEHRYLDLDGRVIVESFDARPFSEYQGMSFTMYDPDLGRWRQTWVDNGGRYLDLAGGHDDGVMDLRHRGEQSTALPAEFRALWHSIRRDRLRLGLAALARRRRDMDDALGDGVRPCPLEPPPFLPGTTLRRSRRPGGASDARPRPLALSRAFPAAPDAVRGPT